MLSFSQGEKLSLSTRETKIQSLLLNNTNTGGKSYNNKFTEKSCL